MTTQTQDSHMAAPVPVDPVAAPRPQGIYEIFAMRVAETPDATAVVCGDDRLSYRQLDRLAGRLARRLAELGVTVETPVALCVERSARLVVALLGVLRAGGVYVALDPRQPQQRHRVILADSSARVLLCDRARLAEMAGMGLPAICLDDVVDAADDTADSLPLVPVTGAHAAYIAYTSGSTGAPKGAVIPHRAVTRLVVDANYFTVDRDDVFLHFAPLAFDASTFEIWGALLNGAAIAVVPAGDTSVEEVVATARRHGVTTMWLTAGLFHQLADGAITRLSGVRQLLAGGDVLSVPHVNKTIAALPGITVVNGYGPTENTTFTCCHVMTAPVESPSVPIGRPVSGTTVWILDATGQPVPDGEPGELHAGGDGVARGYAGHPALTAERFVPDPFSSRPGARMYRTGDIARRLPDGAIEFLGRTDDQVKIRGFRVEPAEVEAALAAQPGVEDVAVVAQATDDGHRLVAYVVPAGSGAGAPALRRALLAVLPAYAVPSLFVSIPCLPLTPNGKVDRRALAARPTRQRPETSSDFRSPTGGLEESLAALWGDLLGIAEVGADDDFFELGGNSLLATRITGEISTTYGVDVNPRSFYENPTVGELAALVDGRGGGVERSG